MRGITKMALANRMENEGIERRYEGGRYTPKDEYNENRMETGHDYDVENRRDRRGRYAPRNEMEGGSYRMGHDEGWIVKPMDEGRGGRMENRMENRMEQAYRNNSEGGRMIGFEGRGGEQMQMHYGGSGGKEQKHGGASSKETLDKATAEKWVKSMKSADGASGEMWSYEQAQQIMNRRNIECSPAEFYAVLNAMASDYGEVAKKYHVFSVDFFADLAKAFIMDEDAEKGKVSLYYNCIAKKQEDSK